MAARDDGWPRFIRASFAALAVIAAAVLAFLLGIDPYGGGRLTPNQSVVMPQTSPRILRASQGRNPAFDSGVIGNSVIQLVNPARLGRLTGGAFVHLSIPGTGPAEQLAILDWFARHHAAEKFLVVGLDGTWCKPGVAPDRDDITYPFPFWLYGRSDLDYLRALPTPNAFGAAGKRIAAWMGAAKRARADGYDDYDSGRVYDESEVRARIEGKRTRPRGDLSAEETPPFPAPPDSRGGYLALEALASMLRELDPATRIALIFPPVYVGAGGIPEEAAFSACRRAAAVLFKDTANVVVLDFRRDGPATRDITNFWDGIHYRHKVAKLMETAIGEAFEGRETSPEVIAAFGGDPAGP